jgi:hypothetical protein
VHDVSHLTWHNLFHTIDGMVALATIALAVVTAALAVMTWWLAGQTRSLVKAAKEELKSVADEIEISRETMAEVREQTAASREQATVARLSMESTFRPVIVNVPPDWPGFSTGYSETFEYVNGPKTTIDPPSRWEVHTTESQKHVHFSLPVRNVGAGVAFIIGTWLRFKKPEDDPGWNGFATTTTLPPNEATRLRFSLEKEGSRGDELWEMLSYGNFAIEVLYQDLGGHRWQTRLDVYKRPVKGGFSISQVFVKAHGAEQEEAVGTGSMVN